MSKYPPAINRALYARGRSNARTYATCASYARYEAEKVIWAGSHPGATASEYEQAMRAIAKACGV